MIRILPHALFAALIAIFPPHAYGDAGSESPSHEELPAIKRDRLPPVIPGEEVKKDGKKMKVWSSSGPVPVAEAPEPWKQDKRLKEMTGGGVGVVIDGRRDDADHNHEHDHRAE